MPELAEVDYFRKRWNPGLRHRVTRVELHASARILRGVDTALLVKTCTGRTLTKSEASAKQMLFRLGRDAWLGIHLGMTGELRVEPADYEPARHDHLVLHQVGRSLVFCDPRQFGRVQFHRGNTAPDWWSRIAPALLSAAFTPGAVSDFLIRRARTPIKAVLLMQERFPGVGNWMADEILWRAGIHPRKPAGRLSPNEVKALHRECRWVARHALATIGKTLANPPASWLFPHRWAKGGHCPRTGARLKHATIGGRTTCWSPGRQPEP